MKEKFFSNLAFMLAINLVVKPFYIFGVDRAVQARVNAGDGEGTYGHYFALFNFAYLFYILLDLGLTDYNKRDIAQHPEKLREKMPAYLGAKLVLTLVYFATVFLLALGLGYGPEDLLLLLPLAFVQTFISFVFYFRSNLAGLLYFRWDGIFSVLDRVLMIFICGAMLWGGFVEQFTIRHFVLAQLISYGTSALCSGLLVYYFAGYPRLSFRLGQVAGIIRNSLPLALLVLIMTVYNRIDSIMIERLLEDGRQQADMYARGYRLLDAVQAFALLFAGILMPLYARMIHHGERLEELVRLGFQSIMVFAVTTAVACFFYRDMIIPALYPTAPALDYTALMFGLLMFSFICISCVYVFGSLLTANFNLLQLNLISASCVLGNVLLNFWLIPEYKALGATVATLITQSLAALLNIIFAVRMLKLQLGLGLWVRVSVYCMLVVLVFAGLSAAVPGVKGFLAGGVLSILLALPLRMIDLGEIRRMVKG